MSKKLVLSICSVILIIGVAVGLTYAYFTADTTAPSTVTIGNVKISASIPRSSAGPITSGEPFEVDPIRVKNDGRNDCYVRIRLAPDNGSDLQYYDSIEIYDRNGASFKILEDGDDWYLYKYKLESKAQVDFNARATLTKGAGDYLSEVQLRYYVEAIQTDYIDTADDEYPQWPVGTEIKKYEPK